MTLALPDFSKGRTLVLGDIMLDRYWLGSTSRISPEAPVPVVRIGEIENRLGGAANVAQNLAALGCDVSLCGIIGYDEAGEIVKQLLEKSQIRNKLTTDQHNPTITKLRIISQQQQLIRLDFEEKLHHVDKASLLENFEKNLEGVDTVILSDYAKGTISDAQAFIKLCKAKGIKVLVDPKGTDFSHYQGATLITPNLSELEAVVGKSKGLDKVMSQAAKLKQELDLYAILVTLSEKGMALIEQEQQPLHIGTEAKEVFDVTGAGDTVIATLAASISAGCELSTATKIANYAAGVVVAKIGTATATKEEIEKAISQNRHASSVVSDLEALLPEINSAKQRGEKIVFTNGCFDILHAGHVRYLQQAAAIGDRLVIGVNSDESISKLKGPSRPIVPLAERMEVLAALGCVDWVIPFSEDTPANLIDSIIPSYLVKGGDYVVEDIVGYKTVTENGGEVVVMPFVDGCSTTSIVDKIKSQ